MKDPLFAEQLAVDRSLDIGSYQVDRDEMVDFARQWAPNRSHVSDTTSGFFGGIVAPGVYTLSVFHRLATLNVYRRWAIVAGRALRTVEFTAPVRPGDMLRGRLTVIEVTARDDRISLVRHAGVLRSEAAVVLELEAHVYVQTRPARGGEPGS